MRKHYKNNILTSIRQAMYEPKQSKYVRKVVGSVNKRVGGKRCLEIPEYEAPLIEDYSKYPADIIVVNEIREEIVESECEQLSDNLTVDSGVITFKEESVEKSHPKKISFAPENDEVIEIEVAEDHHPKSYDVMPQKLIAHISEMAEPQKVDYKFIHNSTPTQKSDELTEEVLQSANLIRNHYCKPEYVLDLSAVENTFIRSPSCRSTDDKFVVNLFESRQSKRWKRNDVYLPNVDPAIQSFIAQESRVSHKPESESHKTSYSEPWSEQLLDDNEMFQKLKKERDMECVKMVQASNVLKVIRKNLHKEWSDELLAEKILLETDERYTLLVNKIRDLGYAEVKIPRPSHKATVTLSSFEFLLQPQETNPSKYSEFFIVTLSHGTELLMSKVMSANGNKIVFDEKFTFANLNSDFNIVVKIFAIKLKTGGRTMCSLWKKKTKNFCPMSKIYYENVNTYEMEESSVLKTSFNCCCQFTLTKDHVGSSHFILSNVPGDSKFQTDVSYSFQIDSLKIYSDLSGFLTLALPNKQNEILFWERKWCVLNGTNLSIYNYPSEEVFGHPLFSVNLEYCLVPLLTNFKNCSRKRTFLLKAGRPGVIGDVNGVALKRKSNFVVEKYFFTADSKNDFELWSNELHSILSCLQDWRKLIFLDDDY